MNDGIITTFDDGDFRAIVNSVKAYMIAALNRGDDGLFDCLSDAGHAIEQLQRERDAAVADITPICMKCKYGHIEHMFEFPCVDCLDHDRWEWRGVDG